MVGGVSREMSTHVPIYENGIRGDDPGDTSQPRVRVPQHFNPTQLQLPLVPGPEPTSAEIEAMRMSCLGPLLKMCQDDGA